MLVWKEIEVSPRKSLKKDLFDLYQLRKNGKKSSYIKVGDWILKKKEGASKLSL